jgi:uncharacterized membrane protein YdbT with pleckstrin-like domain
MTKRLSGDVYLLIGIMLVALFFGYYSMTYPELKSKLLPGIVSGIVFVLAGVQVTKELSKPSASGKEVSLKEQADEESLSLEELALKEQTNEEEVKAAVKKEEADPADWWLQNGVVFGWLVGFFVGIYLVGFLASSFIFILAFLKWSKSSWPASIVTAVLATIFIYCVFVMLLQADLFPGLITEAILRT